jgi:hypothetical protein
MNTTEISLPCLRGNARVMAGPTGARVLTGKRKRPDSLFWSLLGERDGSPMAVAVQGLYRGSYADAIADARELYRALLAVADADEAANLARACAANKITL